LSDGGATHTWWTFTGTDFTYDEAGDVSGGIVKHLTLKQVGHPDVDVDISGFSIPLVDIRNFVHANDVAGLQDAFFGGADRFTLNSTESYVLLGLGGNDKFDFGALAAHRLGLALGASEHLVQLPLRGRPQLPATYRLFRTLRPVA
jgi:hypothetical protein